MRKVVKLFGCGCERCGHKWFTRYTKSPKYCAECHSPYWNKARRKPRFSATVPSNKSASLGIKKKKNSIKGTSSSRGNIVKQPVRPTRTTPGRRSSFQTAAKRDVPKAVRNYIRRARTPIRRPTQREIDSAGIGGAT